MARFLIDTLGPTAGAPERHRGAVIAVCEDGHVPGRKETLAQGFAWIDVPGTARNLVADRATPITFECRLDVLSDDPVADLRACHIHNRNKNGIPAPVARWQAPVNKLITAYGFTNPVPGLEEWNADGEGENLFTSEALWNAVGIVHTTADYDSATGIRELSSNYGASLNAKLAERGQSIADARGINLIDARDHIIAKTEIRMDRIVRVLGEPGSTVNHLTRQITVAFQRDIIIPEIQKHLTDLIDFTYVKRRHRFTESVVAQAEAAGGTTTAPLTELIDRTTL